jgi:4-hydroxy-3-methylbut-2-enyl diphosphate reductase
VINPNNPGPDIDTVPTDGDLVWLSQTTLAATDVTDTVVALRKRFPHLQDPPGEDICYASTNRQTAVRTIAPNCDLVLVIGSANSSNSRRLVEVALTAGTPRAHLLDRTDELRPDWLTDVTTAGVTAGASAPETLITDLLTALADHGYHTVHHVTTATETVHFELPTAANPGIHGDSTSTRAMWP